ncbi:glycosyltransferase family 4 protein [Nitratireductor sp. StC3]|uniref:glycosyltransferase family 4 protein n=1 Tax=Nitratireductor sp. StC3 TaxID=2126741 RepID=UPI001304A9D2|nr:glycosyltransferase family 4 protein [Nitratireductor sp. StC3]
MPAKIAFYAPLKSPDHPIPSGDREIARAMMKALRLAGYQVTLATETISYQKRPSSTLFCERRAACEAERDRLLGAWSHTPATAPDLWFTYHPYCKAPDWIGPAVSQAFGIPYVTAEACRTRQATDADWAEARAAVQAAVAGAAANFCLKPSDRAYLESFLDDPGMIVPLPPFIETAAQAPQAPPPVPFGDDAPLLLAVGMMRPGAKMASYRALATILSGLAARRWTLVVVGDGPGRADVEAMFSELPAGRVFFAGALPKPEVAGWMGAADIFVWPGLGEAFGMSYLEAQALGLPVAAYAAAGVPVVVTPASGLLALEGDVEAFRANLARLIDTPALRQAIGAAGRTNVAEHHSIEAAARLFKHTLDPFLPRTRETARAR